MPRDDHLNESILSAQTLLTAAGMKEVDRITIEDHGVPGEQLMEEAGVATWEVISDYFEPSRILVLAGRGNNGGDGLVIARLAHEAGVAVDLLLFGKPDDLKGEALHHYHLLPEELRPTGSASLNQFIACAAREPDVVVDALLGIGSDRPLAGKFAEIVTRVNEGGPRLPSGLRNFNRRWNVVAVDIPTGISADFPPIMEKEMKTLAINADITVTFGAPKIGMMTHPGLHCTGRVICKQLSFPNNSILDHPDRIDLLTPEHIGSLLPDRASHGHKGTFGSCLLLGGSTGFAGAALLMAQGALRSGVGLTFAGVPSSLASTLVGAAPAALTKPLSAHSPDILDETSFPEIQEYAQTCDVVAIGPGLGIHAGTGALVGECLRHIEQPLILDADAISLLAKLPDAEILCRRRDGRGEDLAMTPHPGELARLLGLESASEIQRDRIGAAREAAGKFRAHILLKGAQTIIATPEGRTAINPTGNSGLSKGGSGDILTGLVAGLAAQGPDFDNALRMGAFLHGLAADVALKDNTPYTLAAEDVLTALPLAFGAVHEAKNEYVKSVLTNG